jgi:predicted nucleotidyltransferase
MLPTIDECLSLNSLKDKQLLDNQNDVVMYPLQKFVKLALECNPSVLEWLFVPQKCIRIMEEPAKMLRDNRLMFLSKKIYQKFRGFAYSEFGSLTKLTGETGAKRRDEILKYGYSPKNAMNCIRLLEQGIELLNTANLIFPRPNSQELLAIKQGKWRYEELVRKFDGLLKEIDQAYFDSKLPNSTRSNDVDKLMVRIIKDFND